MTILPIRPHWKDYRGAKESVRTKVGHHNATAQRIADHLNRLIAEDDSEIQQYMFTDIAHDLGVEVDEVRSAISDGGYNGITIGVRPGDRPALEHYKRRGGRGSEGL